MQKCRRLQLVEQFEGTKRTCKRQLDLHNARRRVGRGLKDAETKAAEDVRRS